MNGKTRSRLFALLILAFPFCIFLACLIFMADDALPPLQPLPNPNGYDDLVKAGEMVSDNTGAYQNMNAPQQRELVSTNAEALSLAREGLSNQCGVPLRFSQSYLTNHIHDLIGFRKLAQALVAEGELAEKENRFGNAAKSYLDVIHLGNESGRGGTILDGMLGVAISSLGTEQLQNIAENLDAKSCRETAATLETLIAQRPAWSDVMQQESAWSERTFGLRGQIMKLIYHSRRQQNLQQAKDAMESGQEKENQLLIDLTARAYKLDKGHPPASVSDLAPDYIKTIPQDPFTGTNMVSPAR